MILSAQTIRTLKIFQPFSEGHRIRGMSYGLSAAGYDVRVDLVDRQTRIIPPGGFILAATLEKFTMPDSVVGIVHDKSTWARQGIAVQNTVIEPGWEGYLTLEITNHSNEAVVLHNGDPIAQILLHMTDQPTEKPYSGKYQNQERGPQSARYE